MPERVRRRRVLRAARVLIALESRLAPRWRREEWRREWLGELHAYAARLDAERRLTTAAEWRLLGRCAGAITHLAFLWIRQWSVAMPWQDLRYALRLLIRRPIFSIAAIGVLSLGIGAATAIFTAVHGIVLKPLPFPHPERLVAIRSLDVRQAGRDPGNLSVPDLRDFERRNRSLAAIGAYNVSGYLTLTGAGSPERVPRALVTSGYFRALGVQPALGRVFDEREDRPSPPAEVVISYGLWQRRFGGDPGVLGTSITLSGVSGPIIGVTPPTFAHPDPAIESAPDVFVLIDPDEKASPRSGRYVRAIGRLKEGVSLETAVADLQIIAAALEREHPAESAGRTVDAELLSAAVTDTARAPLWLLQLATLAILAIACGNLATLQLGAAAGRSTELATRMALGAGRGRLVRQLLIESLVLSAIGGIGGTVVALSAAGWLTRAASQMLLPGQRLTVDGSVLGFALTLSVLVGIGFGIAPALGVSRRALTAGSGRRHTVDRSGRRFRSALIAGEVALTVMLLVAAMLLMRSFHALSSVDPGFRTSNVTSFQVAVPPSAYPGGQPGLFYDQLYERLLALPGVIAAGGVNILPLSGNFSCDGIQVEGHEVPKGQEPCAEARSASVGYFNALGVPLRAGRLFTARDDAAAPHVVVINEALAARYFAGESPIGRHIVYAARQQNDSREIVGVVGDVHHFGLEAPAVPEFYTPEAQPPSFGVMTVVVATSDAGDALIPAIRSTMKTLAPTVPIYNVRSLDDLVGHSVSAGRVRVSLLSMMAALALMLAIVGTYAAVAMGVGERRREMVIRLALGASPGSLVRSVVAGSVAAVLAGAGAGVVVAAVLSRLLTALLFHVSPLDLPSLLLPPVVMIGAGLAASWIPARRVGRVNPAAALKD